MAKTSENHVTSASVAQLLGTESRDKQAAIVKQLINMAKAPTLCMTILVDTRTGNLEWKFIGPDETSFDGLLKILEATRQSVLNMERQQREQLNTPQKGELLNDPTEG